MRTDESNLQEENRQLGARNPTGHALVQLNVSRGQKKKEQQVETSDTDEWLDDGSSSETSDDEQSEQEGEGRWSQDDGEAKNDDKDDEEWAASEDEDLTVGLSIDEGKKRARSGDDGDGVEVITPPAQKRHVARQQAGSAERDERRLGAVVRNLSSRLSNRTIVDKIKVIYSEYVAGSERLGQERVGSIRDAQQHVATASKIAALGNHELKLAQVLVAEAGNQIRTARDRIRDSRERIEKETQHLKQNEALLEQAQERNEAARVLIQDAEATETEFEAEVERAGRVLQVLEKKEAEHRARQAAAFAEMEGCTRPQRAMWYVPG
ncbi:hypothetical protein JCM11491_006751 [Sporobolomyces phaffii]